MNILEEIVYPTVCETRDMLNRPEFKQLPTTRLIGTNSALDSLGLVSFLVNLEEKIETKTGKTVSLTSEDAMSQKNSPFRNLETLAQYIEKVLSA
jgi:hypothetical protein